MTWSLCLRASAGKVDTFSSGDVCIGVLRNSEQIDGRGMEFIMFIK